MSRDLMKLKPIHQIVARDLAFGIPLSKICESRGLSLSTWTQIAGGEIFKAEVKHQQELIEDAAIEDFVRDPVIAELRAEALSSVRRLANERDSYDPETKASAATRIQAANSILDLAGYKRDNQNTGTIVQIIISDAKANSLTNQPELKTIPTEELTLK